MMAQASAAPVHRNEKTIPNCSARNDPIGPRRPKPSSREIAHDHRRQDQGQMHEDIERLPTPEAPPLQQQRDRDARQKACRHGREGHLEAEPTAVHSSGESQSLTNPCRLVDDGEALPRRGPLPARSEIIEKDARVGIVGLRGQRHRVNDGLMAPFRKGPEDFDIRIGRGVGPVDDAERRLAARDEDECRPDALSLRNLVLHRIPRAELLQGRLAVLAGRHRIDICHGEAAGAQDGWRDRSRAERYLRGEFLGGDQHQGVAEQVHPGLGPDQVPGCRIVHPVEIRRKEDIGRRARLDLLGQRIARRIGHHRFPPVSACPGRADVVQRVLEACGGEDHDLAGFGPSAPVRRRARNAKASSECPCAGSGPRSRSHAPAVMLLLKSGSGPPRRHPNEPGRAIKPARLRGDAASW